MVFRKDINGLRAIAVIAVVIFHFNESWMPGGFAGVDVFFVISGFLMTGIIFNGLEKNNFSLLRFYVDRANRIIPALALLCVVLLIFGWFFLSPIDYKILGKHVGASISFLSNVIYWNESGYFDASSHDKWLLHTWSLSVEWQFYIIYPLAIVFIRKLISTEHVKKVILSGAIISFIVSIVSTYTFPSASYFFLPTRAWEMMVGGVAFLYPLKIGDRYRKHLERFAVLLIAVSYFIISKDTPWPGLLSILPVLGTYLILQTNRDDSFITGNAFFQRIGSWSYSIYLWHWPLVVAIYYFSLSDHFVVPAILMSFLLGYGSSKYIERMKINTVIECISDYLKCKVVYVVLLVGIIGSYIYIEDGFSFRYPSSYLELSEKMDSSPLRSKCHISSYRSPDDACSYFVEDNVKYAVLGDSHSTEIAYALAEKLQPFGTGVKHFSFSSCVPSYNQSEAFSDCSKWYNEVVEALLIDNEIEKVVLNHYFTNALFGGNAENYPGLPPVTTPSERVFEIGKSIDDLIVSLANRKDKVYVFYPIPELPRDITSLLHLTFMEGNDITNITGTSRAWYEERNKYVIQHFRNASYPSNVVLVDPAEAFCDEDTCYATKQGDAFYFDSHHVSVTGARRLVNIMNVLD